MRIAVLQERAAGERRVAATPETVKKFCALGATVALERGAGEEASIRDADYEAAGAALGDAGDVVKGADIVLAVRAPAAKALAAAAPGAWVVALFDPFNERQCVADYAAAGLEALSMEYMPRITRAQ
jgi:NAD(P) transhydrogenase subunit alpha